MLNIKINSKLSSAFSRLGRGGFYHIVGSSLINKALIFLCGVLLVRIISKDDYGVYTYALNIYSFFLLFSGMGTSSGILQLCSESDTEKEEIFTIATKIGLLFNVFLCLAIVLFAYFIHLPINGANRLLFLMSGIPLVSYIFGAQQVFLRTELRNKEYAKTNTLQVMLYTIFSISCAIFLYEKGVILAQYVAYGVVIFSIHKQYKIRISLKKVKNASKYLRDILKLSIISMLNNGISQLMYLLDIFILGIIISSENIIASYKIATIIPSNLVFIPLTIMTYVYPHFARNNKNKHWAFKNYIRLVSILAVLNALISVFLFFTAPFIIKLLFGNEYMDALTPFRILCISYFFSGTFRIVSGNLLITQRKLIFNLCTAIVSSIMNTILNVFLIMNYASTGAAIATLCTVLVTSIANTVYLLYTIKRIPEEL